MTHHRRLIRLIAADILAHLQAVARDFSGWLGRAVSQYSSQIFDDGLTLTPLAESFGVPRSEMEGGLRRVLGAPPIEYAERVRLEVSARALRRTELPVGEIAGTVGFGSRERLDEAFIRTFNKTPEAYRARRAERVLSSDPERAVRALAGEVPPRTIDRVSFGLASDVEVGDVAARLASLYPESAAQVLAELSARRVRRVVEPPPVTPFVEPGEEPFVRPPEESAPRSWIRGERVTEASVVLGEAARQGMALGVARAYLEQAEAATVDADVSPVVHGELLHALSGLLWYEERPQEAMATQRGAVMRFTMAPRLYVRSLVRVAMIELQSGRRDPATENLLQAWKISVEIPDETLMWAVAYGLGVQSLALGGVVEFAQRWIREIEARRLRIRHRWSLDLAVHLQGLVELAADEVEQATDTLRTAHRGFLANGGPEHGAIAGFDLALSLIARGGAGDEPARLFRAALPTLRKLAALEAERARQAVLPLEVDRLAREDLAEVGGLTTLRRAVRMVQERHPTIRLDDRRDDLVVPI